MRDWIRTNEPVGPDAKVPACLPEVREGRSWAAVMLDEGALDETAPLAFRNLAAALFRLQKSPNPAALEQALGAAFRTRGARADSGADGIQDGARSGGYSAAHRRPV